jgi:hypothetical protein
MGQSITNQVTDNLQRNVMPQISSSAMSTGGFGGSRQGVVEANAMKDANTSISNALANMYGTDWTNSQNRALQQQSLDNSYSLGMGNLGLGYYNSDNNFYNAQRGQDLQSAALGAQLTGQANSGYLSGGQGIYNVGSTYQNAPWSVVNNSTGAMSPWAGNTGSTSGSSSSSPLAGLLGGAMGGAQLYNLFGGRSPTAQTT